MTMIDDPQQILYGRIGERRHGLISLSDLDPAKEEMLMHAYLQSLVLASDGLREYKQLGLQEIIAKTSTSSYDLDPDDLSGSMAVAVIQKLKQDNFIQLIDAEEALHPADASNASKAGDTGIIHYRPTEEGTKVLKMWDLRALSRMQL